MKTQSTYMQDLAQGDESDEVLRLSAACVPSVTSTTTRTSV